MPVATPKQYAAMLDAAKGRATPSRDQCHVARNDQRRAQGSTEQSDGIIQVSTGGGKFASGTTSGPRRWAPVVLAEAAHRLAANYHVHGRAAHRPLPAERVDGFLKPLIAATAERRQGRAGNCSSRTCWTRPTCRSTENMSSLAGTAQALPRESSSRSRPASSAAKKTARPRHEWSTCRLEALHDTRRHARGLRGSTATSAATCSPPRSATCTATTSRAPCKLRPDILKKGPGRRSSRSTASRPSSTSSSTAVRARRRHETRRGRCNTAS